MNVEKDLEHYMMIVESIPSTHPNLQDFEEEAIHEVLGALRSGKTKVLMTKIKIDKKHFMDQLNRQIENAVLGIVEPRNDLEFTIIKEQGISIPDVMSVFDDFTKGDATEDERNVFFEMLKDKVIDRKSVV